MTEINTNESSRPPELRIEEQILIASSGGKEYEISVDDIESMELREKLPNDMVRIMGTGMENLSKGKFKSETLGRLELCLDPTCRPFILIDTGEEQYLLGTRDSEYTELMYQQLMNRTE